jgi:hypothetical protein
MFYILQWLYTYVANVCMKCFICFSDIYCKALSRCCICYRCCKSLFGMFHPFQTHVANVISRCCICFTQMLHAFVLNVLFVSDVRCSKNFFCVASVFIFQALNGTARVTRRTSVGRGASAIQSRRMQSPHVWYGAWCSVGSGAEACSPYVRARWCR